MLFGGWLGLKGDEGPGKLGNGVANRMQILNHTLPNGTSYYLFANTLTHASASVCLRKRTRRIETSYYPQEEKAIAMLLVRATESSTGQTEALLKGSSNVVFGLGHCLAD